MGSGFDGGGAGSAGDDVPNNPGHPQCKATRMNTARLNEYMSATFQSNFVPIPALSCNINRGFVAIIIISKKHVIVKSVYIFVEGADF